MCLPYSIIFHLSDGENYALGGMRYRKAEPDELRTQMKMEFGKRNVVHVGPSTMHESARANDRPGDYYYYDSSC